jgi:hypothetical protein
MSLKVQFASLSLGASVDQQTGSLSIFDVLDEIRTPQVPLQLQSVVLTVLWEKVIPQGFSGKVLIHLLTPDQKQALLGNGELTVPSEQKRVKAVFRFGGFPVQEYGPHRFVVSWVNAAGAKEGEKIIDFEVIHVPSPNDPQIPSAPAGALN